MRTTQDGCEFCAQVHNTWRSYMLGSVGASDKVHTTLNLMTRCWDFQRIVGRGTSDQDGQDAFLKLWHELKPNLIRTCWPPDLWTTPDGVKVPHAWPSDTAMVDQYSMLVLRIAEIPPQGYYLVKHYHVTLLRKKQTSGRNIPFAVHHLKGNRRRYLKKKGKDDRFAWMRDQAHPLGPPFAVAPQNLRQLTTDRRGLREGLGPLTLDPTEADSMQKVCKNLNVDPCHPCAMAWNLI